MKIKRRHRQTVPTLNTASLPDLIFTVLFFFMIVTHMRDNNIRVTYTTPEGTQVTQVARKSAVVYIYVGEVKDKTGGNVHSPVIQVNNDIVSIDGVAGAVLRAKSAMLPEDQQQMTVSLRADRKVKMETITAVKQVLRQANVKRINYSATEKRQD